MMGRGIRASCGFGDGPEAGDAVRGFAVGIAAGFGELVRQVDQTVAREREGRLVQRGAGRTHDLVRLALAVGLRPDVEREDVLVAVVAAGGPVARRALAEGEIRKVGALRNVV